MTFKEQTPALWPVESGPVAHHSVAGGWTHCSVEMLQGHVEWVSRCVCLEDHSPQGALAAPVTPGSL